MIREFADSERDSYLAAENARLKRELAQQKEALEILKKAATDFANYQKWSVLRSYLSSDEHTITMMGRVLRVSQKGYQYWLKWRGPISRPALRRIQWDEQVFNAFDNS